MAQSWHDLLFAHWTVDTAMLRPHIPAKLEIDTFDGQAWLGIVPFSVTGVRLRWTPPLPWLSAFPELNVRTYVTAQEKPGVWFFTLDAANALAVAAARLTFHLPYFRARNAGKPGDGLSIEVIARTQERPQLSLRGGIGERVSSSKRILARWRTS
jgi:uncharacterized protein YqjF (DUF2071 family)